MLFFRFIISMPPLPPRVPPREAAMRAAVCLRCRRRCAGFSMFYAAAFYALIFRPFDFAMLFDGL